MTGGLSVLNKAFSSIPKRAEQRQAAELADTFVDSGVATALAGTDHQIVYGRRGTGKTHALRYMEVEAKSAGDFAVYVDLRTMGSPEGLFGKEEVPDSERATRLLVDVLHVISEAVLSAAIDDDVIAADKNFVDRLDAFSEAITQVRSSGEAEHQTEHRNSSSAELGGELKTSSSGAGSLLGRFAKKRQVESVEKKTETSSGELALNFRHIATSLRELVEAIPGRRFWVLLDEWSSVSAELQPYLGELIKRCLLPLQPVTVKIGAIEQQSLFRAEIHGSLLGLELGADIFANVDLDEFMVFEQNEDRARDFFRGLFFKHLVAALSVEPGGVRLLANAADVVRLGFTDTRAFDELVRAAEGVPRDAINIALKAALRAAQEKISVPHVRIAARQWFQTDKEAALKGRPRTQRLLTWIIDDVIRGKKARAFLVNQEASSHDLLLALFDARVLHVIRRGYSAQDEPGKRYDVWAIDYGAYVDLIQTKSAPDSEQLFAAIEAVDERYNPWGEMVGAIEVPAQDLRAIRRAILDLDDFEKSR